MFQFLFVLVNGAAKSNSRALDYFGLKSQHLPRVGIYDGDSDTKWLLPAGEISTERVRHFCLSFLRGELKVSRVMFIIKVGFVRVERERKQR